MARTKPRISCHEEEALTRAKIHLALVIRHSLATKLHLRQKHAAKFLQTSPASMSRIERGVVSGLTFNQLFRLLARLEPNFQILVAPEAPQPPPKPDQSPRKTPN